MISIDQLGTDKGLKKHMYKLVSLIMITRFIGMNRNVPIF